MENKRLTLQEKMVRIRARIPSLVKQAYSEEVSYDFVKIDDIFRYLTPAMNEYGVNFDIVSETATKKDERGNPMFVEFIPLYQMWIYEADLTFQWGEWGGSAPGDGPCHWFSPDAGEGKGKRVDVLSEILSAE